MNVKFYFFRKRINSTQTPDEITNKVWESDSVILKEQTSVIRPVIRIDLTGEIVFNNPTRANYCYIPSFLRFYYIKDYISVRNNIWDIVLESDPLASFKTSIATQECYIARSSSMADGRIIDRFYPALTTPIVDISMFDTIFKKNFYEGTYILGIVNQTNREGAITYYAFSQAQIGALKNFLLDTPGYLSAPGSWDLDITESTLKALFNPFQYIVSAMWFPFDLLQLGLSNNLLRTVSLGWWILRGIDAFVLDNYTLNIEIARAAISLSGEGINVDTLTFDNKYRYLNYPPFSRYYMHFAPFGDIVLDGQLCGDKLNRISMAADSYYIIMRADIDLITGQAHLYSVDYEDGFTIQNSIVEASAQIAVPVQLGQITSNTGAGIASAIGTVSSIADKMSHPIRASLHPVSTTIGAISDMANGVMDALSAVSPKLSTSGTMGGLSSLCRMGRR